jgi:ribosomal protein S2
LQAALQFLSEIEKNSRMLLPGTRKFTEFIIHKICLSMP